MTQNFDGVTKILIKKLMNESIFHQKFNMPATAM